MKKTLILIFVLVMLTGLTAADEFEFTVCGQEGTTGPSQSQCDSAYSDINVDVNDGIQEWTVPQAGNYRIKAGGAQGGSVGQFGARGAIIEGEFGLEEEDNLRILVGQHGQPTCGSSGDNNCGGGGGSFVTLVDSSGDTMFDGTDVLPLVVAGGGGGLETSYDGTSVQELPWSIGQTGPTGGDADGDSFTNGWGSGGENGHGGEDGYNDAGAGGGFLSDGVNTDGGTQADGFLNGAQGSSGGVSWGGFGGGAGTDDGSSCGRQGGGGGYSGGGGLRDCDGGNGEGSIGAGGGGSFVHASAEDAATSDGSVESYGDTSASSWDDTDNHNGYTGEVANLGDQWNEGDGFVEIELLTDPDDPVISSVNLDDDMPNEISGSVDVSIDDDGGAADDNSLDSCSVTATGQDNGGSTSVSTSISGDSCSFSVDVDDHGSWEAGEEVEFDIGVEDSYDGTDSLSRSEDFFEGEVVLDGNVYPEGGETASTVPEFSLDVSHTGGYTVFANFFLEGYGAVGSEQEVDGSGTASVQYDGEFLDTEEDYEWYVVLEDNFGDEIDRSDDKWEFVTDTGEPDIQVDAGADINYNPGDGPVVDVTPDHSHAQSVQFVRLRDQNGDVVDEVETVEAGESVTLIGEGDSISQDQEYDWTVETEHAGNIESSSFSFTTLTVGVNLASDVPGAEAYNIYRREGSNQGEGDFDYSNGDYEFIGFGESLEIVDSTSDLEDGSSYCYVATASNIAGESEPSSEICTEVNTQ